MRTARADGINVSEEFVSEDASVLLYRDETIERAFR
jgi:hypothetical protein